MHRGIGSDFSKISLVWGKAGNGLSFLEMEGMANESPFSTQLAQQVGKEDGGSLGLPFILGLPRKRMPRMALLLIKLFQDSVHSDLCKLEALTSF